MTRATFAWLAAALLLASTTASAQTASAAQGAKKTSQQSKTDARLQYHAAQAALYSALAHATALELLAAEQGGADMDLARSYVHTMNRDANSCDGDTVKMGQAVPSLEKEKNLKEVRKHLHDALSAIDDAQNAVDGHGGLEPAAKKASGHLMQALNSLNSLADAVGAKPLPAPGSNSSQSSSGQ
jgi:hypothetical protein